VKVIDYIERSSSTLISYEIIPPLRGGTAKQIFQVVEKLIPFNPPFIDITSRAAEVYIETMPDGTRHQRVRRKRPGTIGLSAAVKNRFNVETVPHILCRGFTREETEDALIELNYLGIDNVLALTGDQTNRGNPGNRSSTHNRYANDLVEQIVEMNKGDYLETMEDSVPTDFCIGVGGYPEKHQESSNKESQIQILKEKVEAGAHYIVTQMFFNNEDFFRLVQDCRNAGITVPIIPGLKVLTSKRHLKIIPEIFQVQIPEPFKNQVMEADKHEVKQIGIDWTLQQCQELLEAKVPCIHFFILLDADLVTQIISSII